MRRQLQMKIAFRPDFGFRIRGRRLAGRTRAENEYDDRPQNYLKQAIFSHPPSISPGRRCGECVTIVDTNSAKAETISLSDVLSRFAFDRQSHRQAVRQDRLMLMKTSSSIALLAVRPVDDVLKYSPATSVQRSHPATLNTTPFTSSATAGNGDGTASGKSSGKLARADATATNGALTKMKALRSTIMWSPLSDFPHDSPLPVAIVQSHPFHPSVCEQK